MRYRHLRRTLLALLVFGALAVVGAVAIGRGVSSARFSHWLAARIAEAASRTVGGAVRVGSARLELWPPTVLLEEVELEASGLRLNCREMRVDLAGSRLVSRRLELGGLWIVGARLSFEPPTRSSGAGGRRIRVGIRRLSVEDLAVQGRHLPGDVSLDARGVHLGWESSATGVHGFVRAGSLQIRVPGLERVRVRVAARFAANGGRLRLQPAAVGGRGVALRGSVDVTSRGIHADVHGTVDLAELDRVVHAGAHLSGNATVHLRATGRNRLAAEVSAPRLGVVGFTFRRVRGRIELGGDGVSGTLHRAEAWNGQVRGTYRLRKLAPPWPHEVRAR